MTVKLFGDFFLHSLSYETHSRRLFKNELKIYIFVPKNMSVLTPDYPLRSYCDFIGIFFEYFNGFR